MQRCRFCFNTVPSLFSGCNSYSTESSHRGGCRAASLWHHQEAFDSFRPHGRHSVHSFHVSISTSICFVDSIFDLLMRHKLWLHKERDLYCFFCLFSSSFTCGLAGALASNPVDVVRTRMMNQRVLAGNPLYKGTLDGLMQTWKNEGFFALYKGFWPNWLRLGPWNIIVSFSNKIYVVTLCK